MSISPLRAFTGTPSISILTRSSAMLMSGRRSGRHPRPRSVAHDAAATVIDHVFELVPVVPEEALHRPGRGVAECADGVPLDAVRDVQQQRQLLAPPRTPPHSSSRSANGTPSGNSMLRGFSTCPEIE